MSVMSMQFHKDLMLLSLALSSCRISFCTLWNDSFMYFNSDKLEGKKRISESKKKKSK